MSNPEDLLKRNTPQILAERINSAVHSAYELNKDKIDRLHNALLVDAETKLAKLRELPFKTKIRCRINYREDPPGWEVVSLDEFIALIEEREAEISIEEYLKFVTGGLTDPDFSDVERELGTKIDKPMIDIYRTYAFDIMRRIN